MTTTRTRLTVLAAAGTLAVGGLTVGATQADAAVTHAAPRCSSNDLNVTRSYVDDSAGHSMTTLIYRNRTHHSCTISGYPGVDAVNRSGHAVAHAARNHGVRARTVTVAPGGYASAALGWATMTRSGRTCPTAAAIGTIVPNTTTVHRLAVPVGVCSLTVNPTVSGTPTVPHYAQAQHEWIVGSEVSAAQSGAYWHAAAADLRKAGSTYSPFVAKLDQLASLPLTGLTKKQIAEARADVAALDAFFGTPGLYR